MLYLIGGAARTGKTQLACRLVGRRTMPYVPTDAITNMLDGAAPQLGVTANASFLQLAEKLTPYLEALCRNLAGAWDHAVVEDAILPQHIVTLRKHLSLSCCFLGWSAVDERALIRHEGSNAWFSRLPADERRPLLAALIRDSREIERGCTRHGVPYIDMAADQYWRQHSLALAILLERGSPT